MLQQAARSSFLVVLVAATASLSQAQDANWVGRELMPRAECRPKVENREVNCNTLPLPFTVARVNGEWLWIGKAWVRQSEVVDLDKAIAYYSDYLKRNPGDSWAYYRRAVAWDEAGQRDKALGDFTESIRLNPGNADAFRWRGYLWHEGNEFDKAIGDYTAGLRLDPLSDCLYDSRGCAWMAKEEPAKAIADFTEAIRLKPRNAKYYLRRGLACKSTHEWKAALRDFTEVIALEPESSDALTERGFTWIYLGRGKAAQDDFNRAIQNDATKWRAFHGRATTFYMLEEFESAINDYTEAIRLDPHEESYFFRAMASQIRGETAKAVQGYSDVLRINPRHSLALCNAAWIRATSADELLRNGKLAVELAERVCDDRGWTEPKFIAVLAAAYAEDGDFERAVATQQKAIDLSGAKEREVLKSNLELYRSRKPYREPQKSFEEIRQKAIETRNRDT